MSPAERRPGEEAPQPRPDSGGAGMDCVDVLGVRVSVADMDGLLAAMRTAVEDRRQLAITFANPNYVMAAQRDTRLRELMNAFDVNLADGWGIVLAAKIYGKPLPTHGFP
jgi:N-acetylglucosaminyldiphosphoundecaprenol N-acetyl-beta-D-mannosaminyltransferase